MLIKLNPSKAAFAAFLLCSGCAGFPFQSAYPSVSLAQEGRYQESVSSAIAFNRNASRQRPNDIAPLINLGDIYLEQGEYTRAIGSFNEALLVAPNNEDALVGISFALSAQGQYARALELAQGARSGSPRALNAQGIAMAGLKRHSEAAALFQKVLDRDPRNIDVRSNLALSYALIGDKQGYAIGQSVAYAPDARAHHIRNLVLIGFLLRDDARTKADAKALNVSDGVVAEIRTIAEQARAAGTWNGGLARDPDANFFVRHEGASR